MFRHLEFILRELSIGLYQFDVFAVAAGPGSFTGLRVGPAAVVGLRFGKPIAAVSALEAVAAQALSAAPFLAPVLERAAASSITGSMSRLPTGTAR